MKHVFLCVGKMINVTSSNYPNIKYYAETEKIELVEKTLATVLPKVINIYHQIIDTEVPFGQLKIIYVPNLHEQYIAAFGCLVLSDRLLLMDKYIPEKISEIVLAISEGMANLWFGIVLFPESPSHTWILKGLCGWLQGFAIQYILGHLELELNDFN